MQDRGNGTANGNEGDPAGGGDFYVWGAKEVLCNPGYSHQGQGNEDAD